MVWVVTAVSEVPVATIITWKVLGAALLILPFEPQPDIPAAKAKVQAKSRRSNHEGCVLTSFRLRRKTANPVRPPGHQKANANNVGFSCLAGDCPAACCAVVLICSATVTLWSFPLRVTGFWANAQVAFVGK